MPKLIDNLIAFRILYLLVMPFSKSDAFKLGIVDEKGKLLKPVDSFTTDDEKAAYSYLHRLCFNLKRLIGKLPGGNSMIASLAAAYFLIKEGIEHGDLNRLDERFEELTKQMNEGLCLVEEQLLVEKFLDLMHDELNEDGAPAMSGGASIAQGGVGTTSGTNAVAGFDKPIDPLKPVKKRNNWKDLPSAFGAKVFEVSDQAYSGYSKAKEKGARWNDHLVPSDADKDVYDQIRAYSKTYSKNPILIKRRSMDAYQYIKQ